MTSFLTHTQGSFRLPGKIQNKSILSNADNRSFKDVLLDGFFSNFYCRQKMNTCFRNERRIWSHRLRFRDEVRGKLVWKMKNEKHWKLARVNQPGLQGFTLKYQRWINGDKLSKKFNNSKCCQPFHTRHLNRRNLNKELKKRNSMVHFANNLNL